MQGPKINISQVVFGEKMAENELFSIKYEGSYAK